MFRLQYPRHPVQHFLEQVGEGTKIKGIGRGGTVIGTEKRQYYSKIGRSPYHIGQSFD